MLYQWIKNSAVLAATFTVFSMSSSLSALPFNGTEITIFDGDSSDSNAWYGAREDQEVEPGMATGQVWDLEGWFTHGSNNDQLAMVGGYDFVNGEAGNRGQVMHGDIFIDLQGDYIPGNTTQDISNDHQTVKDTFGYEYALDLDFENFTYDLIQLTDESSTITPYLNANYGSTPWRYNDGGIVLAENISFSYETGLSDIEANDFLGGNHNTAYGFDLSFLGGAEA